MSFDFIYYPLVYRAGRESDAIPGMHVMQAPSGAHRHRQHDLLAMLLTVSGDHRYDPEEIQTMAEEAAALFFQTQGSVTRAMQAVAEAINRKIFDRNLDRGYEGLRALATLNLAVLHNDWLFVGQIGRTKALFINTDMVETIGEMADPGDYLGLSRRIQMRFSQAEIKPGDLLVICEEPPESWTVQNLAGSASLAMDHVKRRLMNQVIGSLEALVIKFPEGSGKVESGNWHEPAQPLDRNEPVERELPAQKPFADEVPERTEQEIRPEVENHQIDQAGVQPESFVPSQPEELSSYAAEQVSQPADPQEFDRNAYKNPEENHLPEGEQIPVIEGETEKPFEEGEQISREVPRVKPPSPLLVWLANTWMKLKTWNAKLNLFSGRFSNRFNRQDFGDQTNPSSFFMLVLSLAIPVVLIFSSITVYSRGGKTEEHQTLFDEAQQAAALAGEAEDVVDQRAYWAQALELVTEAQTYTVTDDSQALFEKAQTTLDELDLAERLDFKPALANFFPDGVVVSRIESSTTGVYMLDETTGSILRIARNAKDNYELDGEFQCSPGSYGLITVEELVDFIVLPSNEDNYRVMAMDAVGNMLYCQPDEYPDARTLSTPGGGWGEISSVVYVDDSLYVMDKKKSAIWVYEGIDRHDPDRAGIIFSESPKQYFDEDEEPPDLGGAIDLAVNKEDMYILHEDGHMTFCQYSTDVESTECQDPSPYGDNRAGREKEPWIFMDSRFELMQQTKLPNAAIYILDGANRSIDKFSYQMNLEKAIKAQVNQDFPVPDMDPTGFGITSDMEVFLAFENQLFIAPLK